MPERSPERGAAGRSRCARWWCGAPTGRCSAAGVPARRAGGGAAGQPGGGLLAGGPGRGVARGAAPARGPGPLPGAGRARTRRRPRRPGLRGGGRRRSRRSRPASRSPGPGRCAVPTRGPSRYFGGDEALAAAGAERVDAVLAGPGWPGAATVGVADGPFAAGLAAESAIGAPGGCGRWCRRAGARRSWPRSRWRCSIGPAAGRCRPTWCDVLGRLGLRTLGAWPPCPPPTCSPASGSTARPPTAWPGASTSARPTPGSPPRCCGSRPSSTRRPSGSTPPPSWPRRWPTSCTPASTGLGPGLHPGGASWPRPSTASRSSGCGATRARCPRGRSPTGCAGSSTGGSTARPPTARPAASPCWPWCPTRWWRPPGASSGSGEGRRRATTGPGGRSPGCRACSAPMP